MAVPELPPVALSIRQPWVWAILQAGKDVENRSWSTKFRGPIALHAAKTMTRAAYADVRNVAAGLGIEVPPAAQLARGGIVGTAEIVDCVSTSDSPWFFGPYGLVLRRVRPVPFLPVRGALGLFAWRERTP
ncbi:MAG: ASCH domain-containing protein [Pseudomonadota bacterium]